jgi:hypothetical protein
VNLIQNLDRSSTRRDFVRDVAAGVVALAGLSPAPAEEIKSAPLLRMPDSVWSALRGFNYQPSYGSSGFELWQKFDAKTIAIELERGRKFFPKINVLRWWQSWDSYLREPKRYTRNFDTTLDLAEKAGCRIIPCLFNRWHTAALDYGGIYLDHFLPGASGMAGKPKLFDSFLEALVARHKDDPRILAWDLCNEPFFYATPFPDKASVMQAELAWLKSLRDICKSYGAQAPLTVGISGTWPELTAPLCDLLSIHPYLMSNAEVARNSFARSLDNAVAFALKAGKPLLATECCWGAFEDGARVEFIRNTLTELKRRNIGWTAYLLHHSLIADAHRPEYGPLSPHAGNLAFIEADGSLRPGHAVFNEF